MLVNKLFTIFILSTVCITRANASSKKNSQKENVNELKCVIDEKEDTFGIQEVARRTLEATSNVDWEHASYYTSDKSTETKQIVSLLLIRILNVLSGTALESSGALSQKILDEGICEWPAKVTPAVISSLEYYVKTLMDLHNDVYYHNRNHTFHVFNNANKILDLILKYQNNNLNGKDPMLGFDLIFSSLIHDIRHPGISNQQFSIQYPELSADYNNISPIEKNSLILSFSNLQEPEMKPLREILFGEELSSNYISDYQRFYQIVSKLVLNTDIFNPDKKIARGNRLEEAYGENTVGNDELKTLVFLEYLLLVSDVGGAMQNWERFKITGNNVFFESKAAFESGKSKYDPQLDWLDSQTKFLENHCLDLVKKLARIGVPQPICDMLSDNVHHNLNQWSQKGEKELESAVLKWESKKKNI